MTRLYTKKKKATLKALQKARRNKKKETKRSILFRSFDPMRIKLDSREELIKGYKNIVKYEYSPDVEECILALREFQSFKKSILFRQYSI